MIHFASTYVQLNKYNKIVTTTYNNTIPCKFHSARYRIRSYFELYNKEYKIDFKLQKENAELFASMKLILFFKNLELNTEAENSRYIQSFNMNAEGTTITFYLDTNFSGPFKQESFYMKQIPYFIQDDRIQLISIAGTNLSSKAKVLFTYNSSTKNQYDRFMENLTISYK